MLDIIFLIFLGLMVIQGLLSVYLSLYIWEDPERISSVASPKQFAAPHHGFTVILPAHHEEAVIAETVKSIANSNYPSELLQIIVICHSTDRKTVEAAKRAVSDEGLKNVDVLSYTTGSMSKPFRLNLGLKYAKHDMVVIFDAEDEVNKDIFNIANTLYQTNDADIIQAGVQLMDYNSKWFSAHNVLEYFFWFKSRMHFHTKVGVVPLGGNTVFFKAQQLREVGGWNEICLTEDAEIGIRMSLRGAKILSTYDPQHITKEETPHSIAQFIKQRTRWNQGFIQVLRYGHWLQYDRWWKRLFCFYTLSFPITQTLLLLATPLVLAFGLFMKVPAIISLIGFVPLFILFIQYIVYCLGMREFIKEQHLKRDYFIYIKLLITLFPYQLLLGIGALRATYRELRGINNWEKTAHSGLHRVINQPITEPSA